MVLGIRSKSRKSVSVEAHYIIHVKEIKPWPPSQSLRSAHSVLLQWENGGGQSYGSLTSTADSGKIEFNESFKLLVLMRRETSKKGKQREKFQKNCLEFNLYDRTAKNQLLGSASINFADYGIIKETKALNILLNCKKSFRNSTQPFIYVTIQPFDVECSSSTLSPNSSSVSKEFSIDKEESESVSQSQKDDGDDDEEKDVEISSFTDDDVDDIPSNTFQTIRSTSETTGDSIKISLGGTRESNGEFALPSKGTTSLLGSSEDEESTQSQANASSEIQESIQLSQASYISSSMKPDLERSFQSQVTQDNEASTQLNGIKSPSSSMALRSDMENAANDRPSSKMSRRSVKVAGGSSEIRESIQQSPVSYISSSMKTDLERSPQSQVTQEDEASTQLNGIKSPSSSMALHSDMGTASNDGPSPKMSRRSVKVADRSSEIRESTQQSPASYISSSMKADLERSPQSQMTQEDEASTQLNGIKTPSFSMALRSDMGTAANDWPSPKMSRRSVKVADGSSEIRESIQQSQASYISSSMKPDLETSPLSQVTQEDEAPTQLNGIKTPSSSMALRSDMGTAANDWPSPKMSRRSVKVADGSSEIRESTQQSQASYLSSSMKPDLEGSPQSQVTQDDEASTQFNDIKSPSSSMALLSDMGNAANGMPSSPKICRQSGQAADSSPEIRESIQQSQASYISSSMKPDLERSPQSQVTQEDEASTQFNDIKSPSSSMVLLSDMGNAANGMPSSPKISRQSVKVADSSPEIRESIQQYPASYISSSIQPNLERSSQSQVTQEDEASTQFNDIKSPSSSMALRSDMGNAANGMPSSPKISRLNVKVSDSSSEIQESIQQSPALYISSSMKPKLERPSHSQVTQEDTTRDQRFNKNALENVSNVSNTGVMEDKEKMEEGRKGQKQFNMRDESLENELIDNFYDDDSTMKGKLNSATPMLNKKSHNHPSSILMNDKTSDVTDVKFPLQSAENYGISSQIPNQAEEVNTLNDVRIGAACHDDANANDSSINGKTELKVEVEMLQEELREAAALEVSMYSVIAEHGSSSNKVHAPARRLSRFYFHACRVGAPAKIASAAQSVVSGFVLVSKACGNDVPRLTFWFSNLILLRAIVSKGAKNKLLGEGPCINNECDGNGNTLHEEKKDSTEKHFHSWEDPETFLVALEKVEAWIFSRIVESVWWQTLTPYMQSEATKSCSSRKIYEKRYRVGDQDQGSFSSDLWKRAFKDACERLCPLRTVGHECGCLTVIARMVMEQLVSRLDVAMFNAILRESAEEMPTDPISDPISDSKVLPIPAGKSGFGAGAQLKNAIGDWSRWLSDLFSIDDSESSQVSSENDEPKCESSSFKPFHLLNSLSDLMMLPLERLADGSMRKEVCPRFGKSVIKQVVDNFVPDEFCPGPVPDAVLEALNTEDAEGDEGTITSFPCSVSTVYTPPPASSVVSMLQEVGNQAVLRRGSFMLKKLYTSDDELDELDSPLSALGMDDSSLLSKEKLTAAKGGRKVVRYELLRQTWKSSE